MKGDKVRIETLFRKNIMKETTNCESCNYYEYDDEYDCYICLINLDEDDMGRFLSNSAMNCPHFQFKDDYKIVRKQM